MSERKVLVGTMRQSEAELMLRCLQDHYTGDLKLAVINVKEIPYLAERLPQGEPPFFVAGQDVPDEDNAGGPRVTQQREVIVWDESGDQWESRRFQSWQVTTGREPQRDLYIYDTRNQEFIPAASFNLPRQPV